MQLQVTQKAWCDYYIWTPREGELFCKRIHKIDTNDLWKKMKCFLEKFWEVDLAPEIVDPRIPPRVVPRWGATKGTSWWVQLQSTASCSIDRSTWNTSLHQKNGPFSWLTQHAATRGYFWSSSCNFVIPQLAATNSRACTFCSSWSTHCALPTRRVILMLQMWETFSHRTS